MHLSHLSKKKIQIKSQQRLCPVLYLYGMHVVLACFLEPVLSFSNLYAVVSPSDTRICTPTSIYTLSLHYTKTHSKPQTYNNKLKQTPLLLLDL